MEEMDMEESASDTLPQFVVGDPSARFETHTPLTYETNGERSNPSGQRFSATFSKNVPTSLPSTLSMSW